MPRIFLLKLRLVIPLIFALLLAAASGHLQAQYFDPDMAGICPTPSTYGAAFGYFVKAVATPGGEDHHLANKHCFNQEADLSDQNTMESSTKASSVTTTYSYRVGSGRVNLKAEVNASGHFIKVPISGGTQTINGQGSGNVTLWIRWVDTLTIHSITTKPVPKNGEKVDPSQVVTLTLKLVNTGKNVCTGAGGQGSVYKTSVLLRADTTDKQIIGGHVSDDVDNDCTDAKTSDTIQVLLGLGKFRVEMLASALVSGYAKHGDGYAETSDVKVNLGEYKICVQAPKEPADLTITSESGTDYLCPKKLSGNTPVKPVNPPIK
jgi:hypothetical protein